VSSKNPLLRFLQLNCLQSNALAETPGHASKAPSVECENASRTEELEMGHCRTGATKAESARE
jgi:hypothetical protein